MVPGFEPTYEGLKHASGHISADALAGFEPTYEGLKHFLAEMLLADMARFEPTYEGLKLRSTRKARRMM